MTDHKPPYTALADRVGASDYHSICLCADLPPPGAAARVWSVVQAVLVLDDHVRLLFHVPTGRTHAYADPPGSGRSTVSDATCCLMGIRKRRAALPTGREHGANILIKCVVCVCTRRFHLGLMSVVLPCSYPSVCAHEPLFLLLSFV